MSQMSRLRRKKIHSILTETNGLDENKRLDFENMKHDFRCHLADRQSDLLDRQRRQLTNGIRQHFQSLIMAIPSNIQELTLEDITAKGGSVGLTQELLFFIQIPKSLIGSNGCELSQFIALKKPNQPFKDPNLLKTTLTKSVSNKKSNQKSAGTRVMTRSVQKAKTTRNVLTSGDESIEQMAIGTKSKCSPEVTDETNENILKVLSKRELKAPRIPNQNEEMITLCFSTAGTPLLVEQKSVERIPK